MTLHKIGELSFHLLGMNGFHVKAENERFTAVEPHQNLKDENFMLPFGRLRQRNAPKSVLHVQHDHFSLLFLFRI